jgi:hypothetical protein
VIFDVSISVELAADYTLCIQHGSQKISLAEDLNRAVKTYFLASKFVLRDCIRHSTLDE